MSRGRFISRAISVSEKMDDLIDREGYEAALLITWMIPHLDVEGRIKGSAKAVRATVCPLRSSLTTKKVERILDAAHDSGIIRRYEVDEELFIWFPKFGNHQTGLRKNREAASMIPAYVREDSGSSPGELRVKLSKGKVSKDKLSEGTNGKDIQKVWDHWLIRKPTTRRKKLTPKSPDYKLIAKRLIDYSPEDLCTAIDGMFLDEWAVSHKPELTWALREDDKNANVERFIALVESPPPRKRTGSWLDGHMDLMEEAEREDRENQQETALGDHGSPAGLLSAKDDGG